MPKISLSPRFLKDSFYVFKRKGILGLIFGTKSKITENDKLLLAKLEDSEYFEKIRSGKLVSIDTIHRGKGSVYIGLRRNEKKAVIGFGDDTKIANAPDLWVYLSTSTNPSKNLGSIINFGLMSGNKGAQIYKHEVTSDLSDYKTIVVYCKQFEVTMCYALLP